MNEIFYGCEIFCVNGIFYGWGVFCVNEIFYGCEIFSSYRFFCCAALGTNNFSTLRYLRTVLLLRYQNGNSGPF
ncbi:hypothetical protein BAXH7_03737 [Bacillus amyloliquefaciens XH7]|nr:hypothetical protein BAXH7_03737 [Bacillus amyloliquefaciens XH7]